MFTSLLRPVAISTFAFMSIGCGGIDSLAPVDDAPSSLEDRSLDDQENEGADDEVINIGVPSGDENAPDVGDETDLGQTDPGQTDPDPGENTGSDEVVGEEECLAVSDFGIVRIDLDT